MTIRGRDYIADYAESTTLRALASSRMRRMVGR